MGLTNMDAVVNHSKIEIETLYKQYGGMVLRRCQAILKNEQQAMDALQDVFVQLLRNQSKIKPKGLSSLLYRMATNTSLNMIRHQKVRDDHQQFERQQNDHEQINSDTDATHTGQPNTSSTEHRIIELDRINKALAEFPERTREVALYHYVDGFTMDEIAKMMHMSNSNTRRLLRELRHAVPQPEGAL